MSKSDNGTQQAAEAIYKNVFIARQPVFDEQMRTWGYAVFFRHSADATKAVYADDFEATMRVVASLPLCPGGSCQAGTRTLIHFPAQSVVDGLPGALAPECGAILVAEEADLAPEYLEALKEYRDQGYIVAVDNYSGNEEARELLKLADVIVVDILDMEPGRMAELVQKAGQFDAWMLAKRVETQQAMEAARDAGFHLFQGFFFRQPVLLEGRSIPASTVSRLRLFGIIEREEPDFDALAKGIEADVSLSYRLLTFLNSANFSFSQKINSIRQAVVLAGWKPIRVWLRMILLTDLAPEEKTDELTYLSAQRAKFFETMALIGGYREHSESLFLLGLFSLLEAMLDRPMDAIVAHLPLEDDIKDALCGRTNRYTPWIKLARAIEDSDWTAVGHWAQELKLPPGSVSESYRESFTWADAFFGTVGFSD